MDAKAGRKRQAYSQLLFGRGSGGGKDSHSRQWRLSMAVFLNRNKRPSAAPIEVADASLREAASPGVPVLIFPLEGRGGSVSRRDHNQLAGSRAQLAWMRKPEGSVKPIPSYSSGGGPGEGKTAIAASGG